MAANGLRAVRRCIVAALSLSLLFVGTSAPARTADVAARAAAAMAPASFVPNRGQLPPSVRYAAAGPGYALAFERDRVRIALAGGTNAQLALRLLGARASATVTGAERRPGVVSYFRGDPRRWVAALPSYGAVVYRDVWRGIDVVFTTRGGKLEYELRLQPHAHAGDIRLAYDGASGISVDARGRLRIATPAGVISDDRPRSYQTIAGKRVPVASRFVVSRGTSRFGFAVGKYDRSLPLTIDPGIDYSTFLGGTSFDVGLGVTVDASGSAYVTGRTASVDFPTSAGVGYLGGGDAFVAKLAPDGSGLVYAAFLGGGALDEGRGVAVDGEGNAYVAGFTESADFPTAAAQDPSYNGATDGFVAKLDPTGTALLTSTFLGGSGTDRALALALDGAAEAHVTGETSSTDFPVTTGAFDTTPNGDFDVFVTKLDGAADISYSTLLGGPDFDDGLAIAIGPNGNAYVTGKASAEFPTTPGAFDETPNGGFDLFVAQLAGDGSSLVYSTYVGGSEWDEGLGIDVDADGAAYVAGNVQSPDFPVTGGAWDGDLSGAVDAFVTKLDPSGSALVYSTFLGGTSWDEADGLVLDASGRAYVAGHIGSDDFPTTTTAFDRSYNGGVEAFLTVVGASGSELAYSTYLGGNDWDGAFALAVDDAGAAYVAGATSSADFPALSSGLGQAVGDGDAFVTKIDVTGEPVPLPDFTLGVTPVEQAVLRGTPATYVVQIEQAAEPRDVLLAVDGLPEDATASFAPNPAAALSILTIETSATTAPGPYDLTITGTVDGVTRTATVLLRITH